MIYKIKYEEHRVDFLTFDSENEFKEWENQGSCISDLDHSQIKMNKCDIEITKLDGTLNLKRSIRMQTNE